MNVIPMHVRTKVKRKRTNLTEVNFLLALWALWHFVAAVCVDLPERKHGGILWMAAAVPTGPPVRSD